MPVPSPPIYGRVLPPVPQHVHSGPPPIDEPLTGRRGGRQKGTKNKAKVAPLDEFNLEAIRKEPIGPTSCQGCQREITPMTWDLTKELVRSSRDRMTDSEPETRGKLAETDLQYLGARLDGYCSLSCYRQTHG
jgi:hypothetical protein